MPNPSPLKPGKPRPRSYFDPVQVGDIALANRIVMAPLTRDQAGPGRIPTRLMAEY